jgi:hypothetical protein
MLNLWINGKEWQPQAQLGDGLVLAFTIPKAFGFEAATLPKD